MDTINNLIFSFNFFKEDFFIASMFGAAIYVPEPLRGQFISG